MKRRRACANALPNYRGQCSGTYEAQGRVKERVPRELRQVAIMNVAMVAAYYWDGGIWPGVVLHWLAVVIMQWGYGFDKKLAPQLDWPAGHRTDSAEEPFLPSTL